MALLDVSGADEDQRAKVPMNSAAKARAEPIAVSVTVDCLQT
jgi:hypothetical protein